MDDRSDKCNDAMQIGTRRPRTNVRLFELLCCRDDAMYARDLCSFLEHHVIHICLGSKVVVNPEKREVRDLEELLVRVLLVDAKLVETGLSELAHKERVAWAQVLLCEAGVVHE